MAGPGHVATATAGNDAEPIVGHMNLFSAARFGGKREAENFAAGFDVENQQIAIDGTCLFATDIAANQSFAVWCDYTWLE